ncbi:cupin domain-containing protein [Neotabrizicola sp. VNH66]|uniref:cupin domain-containing protein n=1 Tax=Neotabrizicola sp. VNH66 TaxID=3400918 RepID=UPI003C08CBD1
MKVDPATAPLNRNAQGVETLHLSDAGGLRQFGCYLETLPPGAASSERHWHSAEDEFLFLLSGSALMLDDDGETLLLPGDAVCWPHGNPNAHRILNDGDTPCRYLIAGSRVAGDICTYPDSGRKLVNHATTWEVLEADGTRMRGGDLPPHLMELMPAWGLPWDPSRPALRHQSATTRQWVWERGYVHPVLGPLGDYHHAVLGDPGGLTQFGVHLETLPPGGTSSFRHWHETEDEMIYVLSGFPTLVEEEETRLAPGDAACWPAGHPTGHRLENRTPEPAQYLTLGTRLLRDVIHYPDHDLITIKEGAARRYLHADGTPRGGAK